MGYCWNGLGMGGMGGWGGLGIVGFILALLFTLSLLALVVVAALWLVRRSGQQVQTSGSGVGAIDIARQRLAAGEITVSEFHEIRQRLQE
jgi:uncharacterized membrane protein